MYLVLSYIVFVVLSGISSRLVWSIVEPISVVETIVWEPRASYVHREWGVIVLHRHVGWVILGRIVPLLHLVLSSSGDEGLMLPLLSKCVLEHAGWLYSAAGMYAFNKLLSFSDVDCVVWCRCSLWQRVASWYLLRCLRWVLWERRRSFLHCL